MSLCASVYMCFVVTCWERADLLALVCGVCCEFVTFPLVSWVRCGTWLYRLLIFAPLLTLWSPAGKGLTSWLTFVVSNCEFVTFLLVSWVRCGTWLYRFLIFAPLLTFIKTLLIIFLHIWGLKWQQFISTGWLNSYIAFITLKINIKEHNIYNCKNRCYISYNYTASHFSIKNIYM